MSKLKEIQERLNTYYGHEDKKRTSIEGKHGRRSNDYSYQDGVCVGLCMADLIIKEFIQEDEKFEDGE